MTCVYVFSLGRKAQCNVLKSVGAGLLPLPSSLPVLLLKVTLPSAPSFSFPIFVLNALLEPMSQLFHGLAGGYALLSNLYSTHACISILFRVSVHYKPIDISLQLRTKVERKRGRERDYLNEAHIVFLSLQ